MIYRLELENFFCFRNQQTLDLTVPRSVPDEQDGRLAPIFHGSDLRAPKVVVAFGANGSGKSTILKAVAFLFKFVAESYGNERFSAMHCMPFNATEHVGRPTRLAMEYGGVMTLSREAFQMAHKDPSAVPHGTYRYEITLAPAGDGGTREILSEVLKQRPDGRGKWTRTFERDGEGRVAGSKNFSLSGYAKIVDKLPSGASLIPSLAKFHHEPSQALLEFAQRYFSTDMLAEKISPSADDVAKVLEASPKMLEAVNTEIYKLDAGVKEVAVRQQLDGPALFFRHSGLRFEMNWFMESTGTRSFVQEFPFLYRPIMAGGGIAVVDEPDHAVHPSALMDVLDWYHGPNSDFRGRVQLWMSSQNAVLMDDLTKEEIALCEKGLDGSSEVFSLADIKGVRRDDNYRKKYLSGVYGAVPQSG